MCWLKQKNKQFGFTLIELLVVIVIIGILATISTATFGGYSDKARVAKILTETNAIRKQLFARMILGEGGQENSYWFALNGSGDDKFGKTTGIIHGADTVEGLDEGALDFNGSSDYVDVGNFEVPGDELTISAWVYAEEFDEALPEGRIISKANGFLAENHIWMLSTIQGTNGIVFRFRLKTNPTGTTTTLPAEDIVVQEKRWYHVMGVYTGTEMIIYIDGKEAGRTGKTGTIVDDSGAPVNIGRNPVGPAGERYWNGMIDDVLVFPIAYIPEGLE